MAVAAALGMLATVGPVLAANVTFTPVRQVGQSGHAAIYPWGMETDLNGTLLVGDYLNFRVVRYDTSGNFLGTVIPQGTPHMSPYGISVDPNNDAIYMGDVDAGAYVDKYDQTGTLLCRFGGSTIFTYPSYVAVASNSEFVVADSRSNKLVFYDGTCGHAPLFSYGSTGKGPGQFNTPRGIAIDNSTGNLFVADVNNSRIQVIHPNWTTKTATFVTQWKTTSGGFRGIALDATNHWLYVVAQGTGLVLKYNVSATGMGAFLTSFGGTGTTNGKFLDGGRDVTVDHSSNVWVADLAAFRFQEFDSNGNFLLSVPNPAVPPPPGGFNNPADVSLDASGNIFVADTFNWRIQKFSANGTFLQQWGHRGSGNYGYNYPRGVAVDRVDGSVIVGDSDGQMIEKYTNFGVFVWALVGPKAWDMSVGANETIYAADTGKKLVDVISPSGTLQFSFSSAGGVCSRFSKDRGIGVDPSDGTLWVADANLGVVEHIAVTNTTASCLGQFGSLGTASNQFVEPVGVAVDAKFVYVSDQGSNQIKVWDKAGNFITAYGRQGTKLGQFQRPQGLEIGPDGHLYVAEQGNERIQDLSILAS